MSLGVYVLRICHFYIYGEPKFQYLILVQQINKENPYFVVRINNSKL